MDLLDFTEQLKDKLSSPTVEEKPKPAKTEPVEVVVAKKKPAKEKPVKVKKEKVVEKKFVPPPHVDKPIQYGERHWEKTWCVCLEDDKFVMYADGKNVGSMPRSVK